MPKARHVKSVQPVNNTFEWRTLPLDTTIVKDFIEKQSDISDGLMMPENLLHVNIATWIAGREIIDEKQTSDMDETE